MLRVDDLVAKVTFKFMYWLFVLGLQFKSPVILDINVWQGVILFIKEIT